jgi:hypothetical protein
MTVKIGEKGDEVPTLLNNTAPLQLSSASVSGMTISPCNTLYNMFELIQKSRDYIL